MCGVSETVCRQEESQEASRQRAQSHDALSGIVGCSAEDPDPVIFGMSDPYPVLFSPESDPTCNNIYLYINYFHLGQNI